jgi:hypothetical protein
MRRAQQSRNWRRFQLMDGGEDLLEEIARDRDLGELQGNLAGIPRDAGADVDVPSLIGTSGTRR